MKDQLSAAEHHVHAPQRPDRRREAVRRCVVKYAGQPLTTGKQAECYANDYIGLHVKSIADGQTYADLGAPQRELTSQGRDG